MAGSAKHVHCSSSDFIDYKKNKKNYNNSNSLIRYPLILENHEEGAIQFKCSFIAFKILVCCPCSIASSKSLICRAFTSSVRLSWNTPHKFFLTSIHWWWPRFHFKGVMHMCLCSQSQLSICLYAKASCLSPKYSIDASIACNLPKTFQSMCCCIVNSLVTFSAILSTNVAAWPSLLCSPTKSVPYLTFTQIFSN